MARYSAKRLRVASLPEDRVLLRFEDCQLPIPKTMYDDLVAGGDVALMALLQFVMDNSTWSDPWPD